MDEALAAGGGNFSAARRVAVPTEVETVAGVSQQLNITGPPR